MPGIDDRPAARAIVERHEEWAKMMPQEAAELWDWLAALDRDSREALVAHVVAQSVNALVLPHERKTDAIRDADRLAQATGLAMRDYWSPTVPAYIGRVTKAAIIQAVEKGVSNEAAQRLGSLTKAKMAREAERLLVETVGCRPVCGVPPAGRRGSRRQSHSRKLQNRRTCRLG